jgi:zinc transporter ZupT
MASISQLLIFGLIAAAGNLLGGFLIVRSKQKHRPLISLVAIGAGFMLATIFLEVIPESVALGQSQKIGAMWWMVAGYLLTQFVAHTFAPHVHFGEEPHGDQLLGHGAASRAVVALSVHTFFDGVTVASGMLASFDLGVLLLIATLMHKVPEGFTVAAVMLSAGRGRRSATNATLLVAGATLAGVIAVSLIRPAVVYTLPFSAGVTLYVAASDLIPEVNSLGGVRASLLVILGVALFYATQLLLEHV